MCHVSREGNIIQKCETMLALEKRRTLMMLNNDVKEVAELNEACHQHFMESWKLTIEAVEKAG